eukprot:6325363-Pyramimonas_sp.AAC.1
MHPRGAAPGGVPGVTGSPRRAAGDHGSAAESQGLGGAPRGGSERGRPAQTAAGHLRRPRAF